MFPKNVISVKTNRRGLDVHQWNTLPSRRTPGESGGGLAAGDEPRIMGKPTRLTSAATRSCESQTTTKIAATSKPDDRVGANASDSTTFAGQ